MQHSINPNPHFHGKARNWRHRFPNWEARLCRHFGGVPIYRQQSGILRLRNFWRSLNLLAPGAAHDFPLRRPQSASISDRRLQPPSSRKELDRRRARAWQETMAEIPSASQEGEPERLRCRNRVGHQRATTRLRRITEKRRLGVHPQRWPTPWRLESADSVRL